MKIEINIGKKHFWAMTVIVVLLFGMTMVIAKTTTPAYTEDKPFHDELYTDVIAGKSGNIVTVDDDLTVTGQFLTENLLQGNCISKRSYALENDAVAWCTEEYPTVRHCSMADDEAPETIPTDLTGWPECLDDGPCDASAPDERRRGSLGGDNSYLEIVGKEDGIEGCWQYDREHAHKPYKIELACCK